MIVFRVYNDDHIRKWYGFPSLKDPFVLEYTLLKILNELFTALSLGSEKSFNIYSPKFSNLYLSYFSSSNFNSWGQLPLGYIYNDMIRLIQNQNSTSNFNMTLESIEVINNGQYMSDTVGELSSAYILENYMMSYRYIKNHNNGVLAIKIPYVDRSIVYIISVGFIPMENAGWFATGNNSLSMSRYKSLQSIANVKYGYSPFDPEAKISFECADGRSRENIEACKSLASKYELSGLKKKSDYDTEIKYGNYPVDYGWLSMYDAAKPGAMFEYSGKDGKCLINKFNQDESFDYRLLKKENELIKIDDKMNKK